MERITKRMVEIHARRDPGIAEGAGVRLISALRMNALRSPRQASGSRPPKRVLVIPDKFRGTLSSAEAARAIARGLRRAWPEAEVTESGLADGGEGFARLLTRATDGVWHRMRTVDAWGEPCEAGWGLLGDGKTAVLDLASASGLEQLPASKRRPLRTSTYGTGLVLGRVLATGVRTVFVGLGGSATNDGGLGVAAALGWRFLDRTGSPVALNGGGLSEVARVVPPMEPLRARIIAATDVTNPLFGADGAAFQFAPQKGAIRAEVRVLDAGLRRLARIVARDLGLRLETAPGAGAAGGCGYGFMTFLGAKIEPGFDVFSRLTGLPRKIEANDLVVTGEGCLDETTLAGKGPWRVALLARRLRRPVWGVFGRTTLPEPPAPFARMATLLEAGRTIPPQAPARVHAARLAAAATALARSAG